MRITESPSCSAQKFRANTPFTLNRKLPLSGEMPAIVSLITGQPASRPFPMTN